MINEIEETNYAVLIRGNDTVFNGSFGLYFCGE